MYGGGFDMAAALLHKSSASNCLNAPPARRRGRRDRLAVTWRLGRRVGGRLQG